MRLLWLCRGGGAWVNRDRAVRRLKSDTGKVLVQPPLDRRLNPRIGHMCRITFEDGLPGTLGTPWLFVPRIRPHAQGP
jgi:hypothetical protein